MSNFMLQTYQAVDLQRLQSQRAGETRLGQALQFVNPDVALPAALSEARVRGAKFAILGVPEDVGPRANFGNDGADLGFQAFLGRFLNVQANQFVRASEILLGEVNLHDVQQKAASISLSDPDQLQALRASVSTVDERVTSVVEQIFDAGLTPIAADAINLDPHCDFRLKEGRHSGNGFSYAQAEGFLDTYFVMGLHELKNA
ncbi:arginase [Achlya hypogyna]|uniref:Arginase n=1 Tax=Achlya hypogyna TaxID=1202772 RepID=A0A1V9YDB1_ACHHY|nr:arginase [Achlya hypogyna]